MDIISGLVTWFVSGLFIDTLLWGTAGATLIVVFSKRAQPHFIASVVTITAIYFIWSTVLFGWMVNDLDITIGNQKVIEFLGTSKVKMKIGLWELILAFIQIAIGFKIGEYLLRKAATLIHNAVNS